MTGVLVVELNGLSELLQKMKFGLKKFLKSVDNSYNLNYTVQAIAFETNVKTDMGS